MNTNIQGEHKVFSWLQTFIARNFYVAPQKSFSCG